MKTILIYSLLALTPLAYSYDKVAVADNNPILIEDFKFLKNVELREKVLISIIGDYVHPESFQSIQANSLEIPNNRVDDDQNGYVDDYYGMDFVGMNGRRMTPAKSGHENGIVSIMDAILSHYQVDRDINILPVNIVDPNIGFDELYLKKLADAIDYSRIRGASVISMSLGVSLAYRSFFEFIEHDFDKSYKYLQDAIDRARDAGIILLAAASNNNRRDHVSDPQIPANANNILSVANVNYDGVIQSGFGMNIDIAYYGTGIYVWGGEVDGYETVKGSSLATPVVAVAAAVVKSMRPAVELNRKFLLDARSSCAKRIESADNVLSRCVFSPEKLIQKYL